MATVKTKEEIIAIQQERIQDLQTQLYTIMATGEIPPVNAKVRHSKSFKKFLKQSKDVKDMIHNQTKDLKLKMSKMSKIVKTYNLDTSLHITGMRYVRIATFIDNIEELLHDIVNCKEELYTLPNGYKVKTDSLRYHTFNRSLECVKCGIKGRFLALERCLSDEGGNEGKKEGQGFHLNLYGLDDMGREVLMTKDHIIPKSKGGPDRLTNMQTMCTHCNAEKGNRLETVSS